MKLILPTTVRGDWPIGHNTVALARVYEEHEIDVNPHGAVSVLTDNGWLGIKPEEMEWQDALRKELIEMEEKDESLRVP